ncbi:FAD-dependent oxidoreductase [Chloroflexota bacterium]
MGPKWQPGARFRISPEPGRERFPKLLEPGQIGAMRTSNRMRMTAMGTGLIGVMGEITREQIEWYVIRARGGIGSLCVEALFAATHIDPFTSPQTVGRIDDDFYKTGLGWLVEAIKDAAPDIRVGTQISPGFGAQAAGSAYPLGRLNTEKVSRVSSSTVPSPWLKVKPRALTIGEIESLLEAFGRATARARDVGFEFIEIHGHAGHLLGQFLSPYFNKRTDKYGGDFEGRCRFLGGLINASRESVGPGYPIIVRYSIDEYIDGGYDLEEGKKIAQYIERVGGDGICVSAGMHGARVPAIASSYYPEGNMIPLARGLKEAVKIPVILAGRLGRPELAEQVLDKGIADFINWGRPLITDPELPRKIAEGRTEDIIKCIACNECVRFLIGAMNPIGIRCTVNPVAGREFKYGTLKPAPKAKRIIVIGAGPAGMSAARIAALRGHNVTLYDRSDTLGGQLKIASLPPHKETINYIIDYYCREFGKLDNLELQLRKEVTADEIARQNPDVVIVATGSEDVVPDIPGAGKGNTITVADVLTGRAETGETVLVVGGGDVGCETANFLAVKGKKVTVVEMLDEIAPNMAAWSRRALLDELARGGVQIITETKIDSITGRGATGVDSAGRKTVFKADSLVMAAGTRPVNRLATELAGKVKEVYCIGEARQTGRAAPIRESIFEGFRLAYEL